MKTKKKPAAKKPTPDLMSAMQKRTPSATQIAKSCEDRAKAMRAEARELQNLASILRGKK